MKTQNKLSVVIITKNEEEDIEECIKSASFADEVVVVDSGSVDKTVDICKKLKAKVYYHSIDMGLNFNKSYGAQKATGNWIFSLDADERISPALAIEINKILSKEGEIVAYKVPRRNHFIGQWIRALGWWPDSNIRFYQKGKAKWDKGVHEVMQSKGPIGETRGFIIHYSYKSLHDYFEKFNFFTSTLAGEEWEKGARIKVRNWLWRFFLKPIYIFFRKYFLLSGWREGSRGLFISFSAGLVELVIAIKIWEKQLEKKK